MLNYLQGLFYPFLRILHQDVVWRIPSTPNTIYLTFDDGPTPQVTEQVLDILRLHQVEATFFCIGKNVLAYPDLFQKIISEGHRVGNHSQHHLNGWKSTKKNYIDNVTEATNYIPRGLFRPPYGKIKLNQLRYLKKQHRIIMWDVITHDYDINKSSQYCVEQVKQYAKGGSIIVFHDSEKAKKNVVESLPKTIEYLKSKGFKFAAL